MRIKIKGSFNLCWLSCYRGGYFFVLLRQTVESGYSEGESLRPMLRLLQCWLGWRSVALYFLAQQYSFGKSAVDHPIFRYKRELIYQRFAVVFLLRYRILLNVNICLN